MNAVPTMVAPSLQEANTICKKAPVWCFFLLNHKNENVMIKESIFIDKG